MMTYIKEISLCIVISIILIWLGNILESDFMDKILDSILEVVFSVFAINIASTALIAELMNSIVDKMKELYPNIEEIPTFEKSRKTILDEVKLQGFLILGVIVFMIPYYSKITNKSQYFELAQNIKYISSIGILSILQYFVWLTFDLAKTLFSTLSFKFNLPRN